MFCQLFLLTIFWNQILVICSQRESTMASEMELTHCVQACYADKDALTTFNKPQTTQESVTKVASGKYPSPTYVGSMTNISAQEGEDVTFVCPLENLGRHKIAWMKTEPPPVKLLAWHDKVFGRRHKYRVEMTKNEWHLKILRVEGRDVGSYMCQINTNPIISQEAVLKLKQPPRIVLKPMNSIVLLNQKITFFCRVDGNPMPTVHWRRNDVMISPSLSRYIAHRKNGVSTLRIDPVRDADNNTDISCTAWNGVGEPAEAKARLSVIQPDNLPENFPVIEDHPRLKAVEKSRPTQVRCTVQSPNSRVSWLRDQFPLDLNNSRYSVSMLGNTGSLMIMNSQEKDQGEYECVARNGDYVVHSRAAHLYVKVRRVPPYFSIPPKDTYNVSPGGSVDLICEAAGYPLPRVFWRLGNERLQNPDNAPETPRKNILSLKDVKRSETYTCVAVSPLGNIEFPTKVVVKDKEQIA